MRVLLMAPDVYAKGGIQRYSRYQYRALSEIYGKENIFVCSLSPEKADNAFEEKISVSYTGIGPTLLGKIKFAYQILKLVQREKIDLIISAHVQLSVIAYLAKRLFNIRYMTNVYGLEIWSGLKKRDTVGLLNSDKLIGDCRFILKYIADNFHYDAGKMELLYDPVDLEVFKPHEKNNRLYEAYNLPRNKFIVSTIGRLERNKGHETVIKTLKKLDENIIYIIVGGGKYYESFKKLAEEEGVADRVFFTGRVPEDELVDFYNLADVIVLLSTFGHGEGEGLPLGLIEGSACGKPIIAGNQDGSSEAIDIDTGRANGFLIDPLSQQALVESIENMSKDSKLYEKFSRNARTYVTHNFEYSLFKEKLRVIIDEL